MKLDGMKCPHCGSKNTHAYQCERAGLWDDSTYDVLRKEFGDNRFLFGSTESVIYKCKCQDCKKHFASIALLEVKVREIISKETLRDVMGLTVTEVAKDEQSKD